jgi:hypothetical protein
MKEKRHLPQEFPVLKPLMPSRKEIKTTGKLKVKDLTRTF